MKLTLLKNYITYTFIVIFLSLKVASLHAVTHDDNDIDHCDVCDLIISNNFTPIINDIAQDYMGNDCEFYFQIKKTINYNFIYSNTINITNLFSRPPPFLS